MVQFLAIVVVVVIRKDPLLSFYIDQYYNCCPAALHSMQSAVLGIAIPSDRLLQAGTLPRRMKLELCGLNCKVEKPL